jgi:hypothetical protein
MAFLVGVFEGDIDAWSKLFLSDPLGRAQVAKGHTVLRGVDNPNLAFVRIEFDSADDARAFAEKVRGSTVLDNVIPKIPPTVAELFNQTTY